MDTTFDVEPGAGLEDDKLPPYARMLHAYHRSRENELRAIIATLPITRQSRVIDVASGDGCFSLLLAERAETVVGVDLSAAYIAEARRQARSSPHSGRISFQQAEVGAIAFADNSFDLVWCAQSLFSLPDPLETLREMQRICKTGGYVAVLENDSLHHIIMPWPVELELALKQAR